MVHFLCHSKVLQLLRTVSKTACSESVGTQSYITPTLFFPPLFLDFFSSSLFREPLLQSSILVSSLLGTMTVAAIREEPAQLYDIGTISDLAPDRVLMLDANSNDGSYCGSWPSRADALYLFG